MNKHAYKLSFLMAGLILSIQACYVDLNNNGFGCESGRGPMVTESRALPSYHSITNAIGANVVIKQDTYQEFTITAQENILEDITTRVIDGSLVIDYHGCFRNADVDIFISNPEISAVHNIGSGDIVGDNIWQSEHLVLSITGSGRIDAEFDTERLDAEITGSGRMDLYGNADRGFIEVSGSGDIYAFNLESNDQEIFISGSGNCEVFARDILDVRISGSGNVYYKGNPAVSTHITGSGNVIESN